MKNCDRNSDKYQGGFRLQTGIPQNIFFKLDCMEKHVSLS